MTGDIIGATEIPIVAQVGDFISFGSSIYLGDKTSILLSTFAFIPGGSQAKLAAKTGWKVGEPITNLTAKGNVPAWSTVRQRFWKNEAFLNGSTYSESNLLRMQKGLAPQFRNTTTGVMESMKLHHTIPQRNGGLFEFIKVTPEQHRLIDPFRR